MFAPNSNKGLTGCVQTVLTRRIPLLTQTLGEVVNLAIGWGSWSVLPIALTLQVDLQPALSLHLGTCLFAQLPSLV